MYNVVSECVRRHTLGWTVRVGRPPRVGVKSNAAGKHIFAYFDCLPFVKYLGISSRIIKIIFFCAVHVLRHVRIIVGFRCGGSGDGVAHGLSRSTVRSTRYPSALDGRHSQDTTHHSSSDLRADFNSLQCVRTRSPHSSSCARRYPD